ncbi:MAG: M48 family metallopeptidase [Candidatus Euphemobacter frigidus]|nr:M48 family metallopeptidase [Candidatus Euphemobacter frigidus]MDP8276225.1 M48 family metallopeptidase [Candidatus Euphemobacter frigidus]
MNVYLIIILAILIGNYLLDLVIELLNLRHFDPNLPSEFHGCYDAERYRSSQSYLAETTRVKLIAAGIFTPLVVAFILLGGFNTIDGGVGSLARSEVWRGLIFAGILLILARIFDLPFSIYRTFVLEERYGFNRTTVKTFVLDILKGCFLVALIGGPVFALVIWFFSAAGPGGWIYCWLAVTFFQLFLLFIAPVTILPLFNKFTPIEEGELKGAIERYARRQNFKMRGIFTMDGSRRSARSNAFFTGFGRFRRIVLYDTLIRKHTTDELVAILAHETGHYKERHFLKNIIVSIFSTGLMFFILSRFINNPGLFDAFQMKHISVYASLFFFAFLYAPIDMALSLFGNYLSRRFEYQADAFSARTFGKPASMIDALKKLSVDNLSNLTPHPLKVFFSYTHPPVLDRIRALGRFRSELSGSFHK